MAKEKKGPVCLDATFAPSQPWFQPLVPLTHSASYSSSDLALVGQA